MRTQKSKNIIPEIRIHGNGEKTRDSIENCVEDMEECRRYGTKISSTSLESHTVNSSLFCGNHGSNQFRVSFHWRHNILCYEAPVISPSPSWQSPLCTTI